MSEVAESDSPELQTRPPAAFPGLLSALFLLLFALLVQILIVGLASVLHLMFDVAWLDPLTLHVMGFANLASMAAVVLIGLTANPERTGDVLGFRFAAPALFVAAAVLTVGAQIVVSELSNLLNALYPHMDEYTEVLNELMSVDQSLVTILLLLVVIAPVGEELVFRGVLLHGFFSRYRPWLAIALSAVLFGAIHLNPVQGPGAVVLGLIFGWWRLRSDSILLCIWGHAVNNGFGAAASRVFGWEIPGYTVTGPGAEFQPAWFTGAGILLMLIGIFWMKRLFQARPRRVPHSIEAKAVTPIMEEEHALNIP